VKKYKKLLGLLIMSVAVWFVFLWVKPSKIASQSNQLGSPTNQGPEAVLTELFDASEYKQYRKYLIALTKVESSNYKSSIYRLYYNCIGMNCTNVMQGGRGRTTTQIACTARIYDSTKETGPKTKGIYSDTRSCGQDLLIWLRWNHAPTYFESVDNFGSWLKGRGYFEVTKEAYIKSLKSWI
jgi:hypothetical protein